ncbi:MAG: hypothetical protein ABIZ56_11825 [Chthoniobacteraceae bacterium]
MKVDRNHIPWAIFVSVATLIIAAFFCSEFAPQYLPFQIDLPKFLSHAPRERNTYGASPLGLFYGALALAIFLFASALGVRKKKRLWRIGNVQLWLRAHIWLTILTIPLIAFHSGMQIGGPQTTTLMVLYTIVMVSGFFGLALQNFMPRMMMERLAREVVYEQIPHIRGLIAESARGMRAALLETIAPPVAKDAAGEGAPAVAVETDSSVSVILEFLDEECLPYLEAPRIKATRMRLGDHRASDDLFRLLRLNASDNFRGKLDELQGWCDDRRLMDLQTKMHHWLHGWLLIHVPVSFALLVFTFWHAYITWVHM